jgi:hypothetical protein
MIDFCLLYFQKCCSSSSAIRSRLIYSSISCLKSDSEPRCIMQNNAFTKICVCGRAFIDLGGFTRHEKSCVKGKKRLSSALSRAKEVYQAKKAKLSLSRQASISEVATTSSEGTAKRGPRTSGEAGEEDLQQA